ncbi:ankyrin repeat protein (macronuclear) [Tetrahymena thermophila SB210]|uniref:Ankyrin repeat protein n=1 Tax=Tetrahymena thermophila (strain SB210) TaxID=312017 RepID=Q22DR4_TETTS|nr:ankyrin repeat protein [Tetrahymena thermophila SB210]EAR83390.2 ankyrin repeat protein [Tetrahymena thermophila SB210]|eukprot:XP_001031053.2 ankyrin repeat protein [Tetrahymena thermophila SB210]
MQKNSKTYNSVFFQQDKQKIDLAQTESNLVQSPRISMKQCIQQAYFEQIDINKPNKQIQNYYFQDSKNLRLFNSQRNQDRTIQETEALNTSNEQILINKQDKFILKPNKLQDRLNFSSSQSNDFKLQSSPILQTQISENLKIKLFQTNGQLKNHEKISNKLYYVTYRDSFSKQKSAQLSESQVNSSRTKKNLLQSQFINKSKTTGLEFYENKKNSDRKPPIEGNQQRSLTKILKMFGGQKEEQNSPQYDEYNLLQINSNTKKTLEFEKIDYGSTNKFKFKENISKPLSRTNKNITTSSSSHRSFSQSSTQINFNGNNYGKSPQLICKYKNNRVIQFPVQTLKQLISHRKYEESLNSYLQCNQNVPDQQDFAIRKFSTPMKAEFNRNENKFTIKESTDLSNSANCIPSFNNKFVKLDEIRQKYKKQSSLCVIMNQQNSSKQQNHVSNITIPICKQSQESSLANTAFQIQKPTSLLNSLFNVKSKKLIEEEFTQILDHTKIEDEKQELILNTIQNREKISNIIRLIEESPLDCIQGDNLLFLNQIYEQISSNQNHESIEKSICSNDEQSPKSNQTNKNEQKQFLLNILDDSYMKFTQQVQRETTQYIISKDKMLHFQLFRSQKERRNLTKKQHRANLIKILNQIKNLNLTPKEILLNNVFSTKPFEKQYSYEFITAAKHNNLLLCDFLITKNKYLVYDFDYFYLTALHWASKRGHLKLAQFLIQKGADVNATDILGKTPLYYACQADHIDIVKILLYNKAYPWSNKYISYDQFVKHNPQISNALFKARKIYSLMKMTPFKQRNLVWQQELVAFSSILV